MDERFENKRALNIISEIIKELELDLTGLNILTEVGSNYYKFLPLIALMAGAEKVMAWTRSTQYGHVNSIISDFEKILTMADINGKVHFETEGINIDHLCDADIITNSGFLRPLNEEKLSHCKSGVVIPLMYEKWEYRESDIDLDYCNRNQIRVAGTFESHESINVFGNVGPLAIKMAFEAGYEVFDNRIVVWSNDDFGVKSKKAFESLDCCEVITTTDYEQLKRVVERLDFIFLADYSETDNFQNLIDWDELLSLNPNLGVVHLYGKVNTTLLGNRINVYPPKEGKSKVMSFTLGHVGLKPIINLQAGGLKVGEAMIKSQINSLVQPLNF